MYISFALFFDFLKRHNLFYFLFCIQCHANTAYIFYCQIKKSIYFKQKMGKGRGKGTKKGWKRIDNQNADEVLEEMHAQREMASKTDSELFVEDVEPKEIAKEMKMELTRRQRAALEHRMRISRWGWILRLTMRSLFHYVRIFGH